MKTVITTIALILSTGLSLSQGIYNPLENPFESKTDEVNDYKWYIDPVGDIMAFAPDNKEGQKFLNETLELFDIDRKSTCRILKEGKTTYYYYQTSTAEEFRFYISKSIPSRPYIGIQITRNM